MLIMGQRQHELASEHLPPPTTISASFLFLCTQCQDFVLPTTKLSVSAHCQQCPGTLPFSLDLLLHDFHPYGALKKHPSDMMMEERKLR